MIRERAGSRAQHCPPVRKQGSLFAGRAAGGPCTAAPPGHGLAKRRLRTPSSLKSALQSAALLHTASTCGSPPARPRCLLWRMSHARSFPLKENSQSTRGSSSLPRGKEFATALRAGLPGINTQGPAGTRVPERPRSTEPFEEVWRPALRSALGRGALRAASWPAAAAPQHGGAGQHARSKTFFKCPSLLLRSPGCGLGCGLS